MVSISEHSKEIFYGGTTFIILLFILLGYIFPATDSDIAANRTMSLDSDQGMYTNWFTYLFFTVALLILGQSLYSTFLKMDMTEWNMFAFGTFLLFVFGLSGVFQALFDYHLFGLIKDIVLTIGIICMFYSTYKIYEPFEKGD
ncbi:MAG: hypothetical protein MIO93_07355 [ANME-2 cluster archaeon]|jgi:hypothetical protein|nr:hypothetical protein [ANME-2 cluster archaeon]